MLRLQVPTHERYPDHEMLEAHRQFIKRFHLSRWSPVQCVKTFDFDGWRGDVAYELDWGEGAIGQSILKAFYHKLALQRRLTKLMYFVVTHYPNFPAHKLYKTSKRVATAFTPTLLKHGIKIEVIPVRRVVKKP
jgi:hypothetical protein